MTDEDTIRKLHRIVGFGAVHTARRRDPRRANAKLIYTWNASERAKVIPFMELIKPHMSLRRTAKIDEILKFSEENPVYQPAPYICGTTRTYAHGCRCVKCRAAQAEYCRNLKKGIRKDPNEPRLPRTNSSPR